MERVKWIDNARVIGILLIITGHTIDVTFGRTIFYAIYIVNVSIFSFCQAICTGRNRSKKSFQVGLIIFYCPTSLPVF